MWRSCTFIKNSSDYKFRIYFKNFTIIDFNLWLICFKWREHEPRLPYYWNNLSLWATICNLQPSHREAFPWLLVQTLLHMRLKLLRRCCFQQNLSCLLLEGYQGLKRRWEEVAMDFKLNFNRIIAGVAEA